MSGLHRRDYLVAYDPMTPLEGDGVGGGAYYFSMAAALATLTTYDWQPILELPVRAFSTAKDTYQRVVGPFSAYIHGGFQPDETFGQMASGNLTAPEVEQYLIGSWQQVEHFGETIYLPPDVDPVEIDAIQNGQVTLAYDLNPVVVGDPQPPVIPPEINKQEKLVAIAAAYAAGAKALLELSNKLRDEQEQRMINSLNYAQTRTSIMMNIHYGDIIETLNASRPMFSGFDGTPPPSRAGYYVTKIIGYTTDPNTGIKQPIWGRVFDDVAYAAAYNAWQAQQHAAELAARSAHEREVEEWKRERDEARKKLKELKLDIQAERKIVRTWRQTAKVIRRNNVALDFVISTQKLDTVASNTRGPHNKRKQKKRRNDKKTKGGVYARGMALINKTYGRASDGYDVWLALYQSIEPVGETTSGLWQSHPTGVRPVNYQAALKLLSTGEADINWGKFYLFLVFNEVEDRLYGWVGKGAGKTYRMIGREQGGAGLAF